MVKLYPLSRTTPLVKHPPRKNRNWRRRHAMAMLATCNPTTNYSTSEAAIDKTGYQKLHIITPPSLITYQTNNPSFLFTYRGRKKKRSIDLRELFTPKPSSRKTRKDNRQDLNAVSTRTRSKTEPVSSRTRSKVKNNPNIKSITAAKLNSSSTSNRRPAEQEIAAKLKCSSTLSTSNRRPAEQEILIEFEIEIEERKVSGTKQGHVDETEESLNEIAQVTRKNVEEWAEYFRSKRLKAEANRKEKERQRRLRKEEKEKKSKEEKEKWEKIIKWKKGAEKEPPKNKTQQNTSKGAKKKRIMKRKETVEEKLDRIFQDNQVKKQKSTSKGVKKRKKKVITMSFVTWIVCMSLSFWYYWKYRTIFGLCWFLFHSSVIWYYYNGQVIMELI